MPILKLKSIKFVFVLKKIGAEHTFPHFTWKKGAVMTIKIKILTKDTIFFIMPHDTEHKNSYKQNKQTNISIQRHYDNSFLVAGRI